MDKTSKLAYTSLISLAKECPRIFFLSYFKFEKLGLLVTLKLFIVTILLYSSMIRSYYHILQRTVVEGAFDVTNVLVFRTRKN